MHLILRLTPELIQRLADLATAQGKPSDVPVQSTGLYRCGRAR